MRRFARHLLTILSALSLLLCVAVCVLWVRSFRGNEGLRYLRESAIPFTASSEDDPAQTDDLNAVQEIWILEWQRGLMRLCYLRSENVQIIDVAPGFRFGPLGPWTVASHFDYTYRDARSMPDVGLVTSQLVAPAWFAAAVTAVLPGVLVAHWFFRRARLRRASLRRCCAHCGYDLRAHREGERCPECGTASAGPVAGVTGPSHLQ